MTVPAVARAQMRTLPMSPHATFRGATHAVPFPSNMFVPPRINPVLNRAALHDLVRANRYAMYATLHNPYAYNPSMMYSGGYNSNPYAMYAANPYMMYGSYGGYGGYGGYGSNGGYNSYPSAAPAANMDAYQPTGTKQTGRMIEVGVYDNRFEPRSITITAGATVRLTNYDNGPHTVTSDSGLWDSGQLSPGSSHSYTFSTPGTYRYHCSNHPRMAGTVVVE
jgi:plastocyanin